MPLIRSALRLLLLTAAFVVGTAGLGWWSVPVVALAWGVVAADSPRPVLTAVLAAGLAWGALLGWSALLGPVGLLAAKLGAVMGVPGAALLAATLGFPAALAWPAATLGASMRR